MNDLDAVREVTAALDAGGSRWVAAGRVGVEEVHEGARAVVEVTYLSTDGEGRVVTPGLESWPDPEGAFPDEPVTLAGTTLRAMSVGALLDGKSGWRRTSVRPCAHEDLVDVERVRAKPA